MNWASVDTEVLLAASSRPTHLFQAGRSWTASALSGRQVG
jgi:hypothetical protein